jgi:glyoxylase I family protein
MSAGIPGLTRVDHIGVTVPDLEQARQFFVETLGCEFLYPLGQKVDPVGDWMQERLNVHPRASIDQIYFFRCGGQAIFEVFEYSAPDQRTELPRNSDIGGHHVALYVDDLDAAVSYLHAQPGVTVCGEPNVSKGPHEGQRWIYFLSPWGMQFELVSYPGGKAFDRQHKTG